jgi:hypothetical protein
MLDDKGQLSSNDDAMTLKLEYVVSCRVLFVDDVEVQRLENGGREGTSSLLKDS